MMIRFAKVEFPNNKLTHHTGQLTSSKLPCLKKIFLMLRKDLKESEIPGCIKIHEHIDKMQEEHLERLEEELKVWYELYSLIKY